jgi:hypothetical protein
MGRMTIKRKKKKLRVPYDAELNDLREWQDNMYNPGHYVGTGKVPYPLKNLARRPKLKLAYFLYFLTPFVLGIFFMDLAWYNIAPIVLVIAVIGFIIWDSSRVIKKKH